MREWVGGCQGAMFTAEGAESAEGEVRGRFPVEGVYESGLTGLEEGVTQRSLFVVSFQKVWPDAWPTDRVSTPVPRTASTGWRNW